MKHLIKLHSLATLLAILLATLHTSCSTTRKVASDTKQTHVTSTVDALTQTQTQANEAVNVRTNETDFSNAVIDFVKIEYSDNTEEVITGAPVRSDTVKQRDREQTEPPNLISNANLNKHIKSVTSGRVILNNDKTKQTDTSIDRSEAVTTKEAVNATQTEDIKEVSKTDEKPKRGLIYYIGVIACVALTLLVISIFFKAFNKIRNMKSD